MTFTMLVTCVGGDLSPQMLRTLKTSPRHNVRIVGVDARPDAVGRHFVDAFHVVPIGSAPNYADVIGDLAERYAVDLIYPTSDEEALALAAARERLETGGRRIACNSLEVLRTVTDKAATYRKLGELGFWTPAWRQTEDLEGVAAAVDAFLDEHGAAVAKPATAWGGRGIYVIRNDISGIHPYQGSRELHLDRDTFMRDHLAALADHPPVVVMQRLIEPVFDVDILGWEAQPIRVVARRRLNSALPNEGHVIVGDRALLDLGAKIISCFGTSWLLDCDVMYDSEGRPGVLEINPRPSGSVSITVAAGIPIVDDLISLVKGEPVPQVEIPFGRIVVPFKSLAVVQG